MPDKPEILGKETLGSGHLFKVEGVHLRFSNGEERHFETIRGAGARKGSKGSVLIIPWIEENTILLSREYGAGVDEYVLGFPTGVIDANESVEEAANRELQEEVGYGAEEFIHLGRVSASPAYMRGLMDIVLAKHLFESKLEGDEPEPIEVLPWSLNDIDGLLAESEFHAARAHAALLLFERYRYANV